MINYSSQEEFIAAYNKKYRPQFNLDLFKRTDDDIINALKLIIYSCERDSTFTIKVMDFQVIDDYDEINRILWEYEETVINKNKNTDSKPSKVSKKKNNKNINIYDYVNLDKSDIKLIKITYYIRIVEKKRGLVDEIFDTYIAVPRIVNGFYFRLNGNMYSAMYQIVDASTYNNSASKNSKKQSVTFKTVFTPIRVYRYYKPLIEMSGEAINCEYFVINVFNKSSLLMKYILAKFGFDGAMKFLYLDNIRILKNVTLINAETNYIFPARDMYIVCPKELFDKVQIAQSFVYTLHNIIVYMKSESYYKFLKREVYLKSIGAEFTSKDMDTIVQKGYSLLDSLDFNYDLLTKADLRLPEEDKKDVYTVLRWMMYEFNQLRNKDNLDISTKKVRYAEYIATLYANRLAYGIYMISDKGNGADLTTIKQAIRIMPMYLIKAIIKSKLVNYKICVNDLDSLIALKYTFKGNTGIGEKSNAISNAYRSIHPSHLGRVDIDSSSNSDPGVSGTICPYTKLYNGHFTDYQEPTRKDDICKIIETTTAIESKIEMCRLINNTGVANTIGKMQVQRDCLSVAYDLCASVSSIQDTYQDTNLYADIYAEENCLVLDGF